MLRRLSVLPLIILMLAGGIGGEVHASPPPPVDVQAVVERTAEGLSLVWSFPDPQVTVTPDGLRLDMEGMGLAKPAERVEIPETGSLVAVPPGYKAELGAVEATQRQFPLPAGALSSALEQTSNLPDWVQLEDMGSLRGVHLVRLTVQPARVAGGVVSVARRISVQVRFTPDGSAPIQPQNPRWESLVAEAVVNPQDAVAGLAQPPTTQAPVAGRVYIETPQAGFYAITRAGLLSAGVDPAQLDPTRLVLSHLGSPVAYEWEGDSDSIYEDGERLVFFAGEEINRWTANGIFALENGPAAGPRITTRTADPAGLTDAALFREQRFEQNLYYTPNCNCGLLPAGWDGDRWVWQELSRPGSATRTYPFMLSNINPAEVGSLHLTVIGVSDILAVIPDHRMTASINGTLLGAFEWDGKQRVDPDLVIPAGTLVNGANTLVLNLPGVTGVDVERVYLDAFRVTFGQGSSNLSGQAMVTGQVAPRAFSLAVQQTTGLRLYDVSNPLHPVRMMQFQTLPNLLKFGETGLTAGRYWVAWDNSPAEPILRPARPTTTVAGADMIMIAPQEFQSALAPLAALRATQGVQVVIEDVRAIYDSFGNGVPSPEAIKAYLDNAYRTWSPSPVAVLLAGDGTYDPKQMLSGSFKTWIPPYLASVDPYVGEISTDNRFVTFDGPDDQLADMLIGRLPANSAAELTAMVTKIVTYETAPASGLWAGRAILAADAPEAAGDFPSELDALRANLPPNPYAVTRQYLGGSQTAAQIKTGIITAWNQGAALVFFDGHASVHQWSAANIFHIDDLPQLTNGARLPVVLELSCLTASFSMPSLSSLDEALVRAPGAGATAAWGSVSLGITTGHRYLMQGFLSKVYATDAGSLGEGVLAGGLALAAARPSLDYLLDSYIFFGDPMMHMNQAYRGFSGIYLPAVRR